MFLADLSLQSLRWLPVAVVSAAVAIAGTWWLYRRQVRLRSRGLRWALPLIRAMALVALAIALIKPVILRARTEAELGAILVLIDRSASMDVNDPGRTPAQRIALAGGLKLLPDSAASLKPQITQNDVEQFRTLGDRVTRASSELDYARLADRGVQTAQQRLTEVIADLSAMATQVAARVQAHGKHPKLPQRVQALIPPAVPALRDQWLRDLPNRIERLASAANESENVVAEKLYQSSPDVRAACDRVDSLSRLELAKLAVRQSFEPKAISVQGFASTVTPIILDPGATTLPANPSTIDPSSIGSDINGAVLAALRKYPPGGVRAVVLLSDGRQVGSETTVEALTAQVGDVHVYTVRMAKSSAPRDVSISRIVVPSRAYVRETLACRVYVRNNGIRGEVPVHVTIGQTTQTKSVKINEDGTTSAEFTQKLDQPGPLRVSASIAAQPAEVVTANNSAERWVSVMSDKVRVLAIAQSAGRDFQFLRDALSRTPWVQLEESIAALPDAPAAVTAEQLSAADVIVFEDAGPTLLSDPQWALLRKRVADDGAGLIWLAGETHLPGDLLAQKDAAELLPVSNTGSARWRTWAGEWPSLRPVPDRPTGDASRLPDALRLTDDPESSLRKWQELPAMYRLMNLSPLKPNAAALLIDADTSQPVVTLSRSGAGQVVYVGLTETWRWRYKIGQRDQDRFWLQMVRQVSDEPYAVSAGGVSIDADHVTAEPGKPVKLRVRLRDSAGKPSGEPSVQLSVKAAGGAARTETLFANPPGSGKYEKTVNDLSQGEYQFEVIGATSPKLTIRVAANSEAELANLGGDDRLLRRLADATGGTMLAPDQLPDLPAQLAAQAADHPQIKEIRLWDSPYLFAFVVACFALEWALRKQAGLA